MSWSSLAPLSPAAALALFVAAGYLVARAARPLNEFETTPEWLRRVRGRLAAASVLALVALWFAMGGSSAWTPKTAIDAPNPELERRIEQRATGKVEIPPAARKGDDWEAARNRFREQAKQEAEQFDNATARAKGGQ